jgi:hypothetical protein
MGRITGDRCARCSPSLALTVSSRQASIIRHAMWICFRSNAISTSAMRYDFSGAMAMRDCPMSSTPFLLTRDFH